MPELLVENKPVENLPSDNRPIREQMEVIHKARTIRTLRKHKGEWIHNVKENSSKINKTIADLWKERDYGEGISVAAGPSLKDDLEDLKKMRKHRERICVDASLGFLVDNGLIPDFCVTTDFSDKILLMLDREDKPIDTSGIKLVANVITHPKVIEKWKGEVYWFVMMNNVYDIDYQKFMDDMHALETKVGAKLAPGGNVSSIALGFGLSVRNYEKIILYGHDFCWKPEGDFYAGGSFKELEKERMEKEGTAGTIFDDTNTKGEKVLTNLSLQQFAKWHEEATRYMRHRIDNRTSCTILNIKPTNNHSTNSR